MPSKLPLFDIDWPWFSWIRQEESVCQCQQDDFEQQQQQQVVSKSPILKQDNKPEERLPLPLIHVEAKQQKKKKVTPSPPPKPPSTPKLMNNSPSPPPKTRRTHSNKSTHSEKSLPTGCEASFTPVLVVTQSITITITPAMNVMSSNISAYSNITFLPHTIVCSSPGLAVTTENESLSISTVSMSKSSRGKSTTEEFEGILES